MSDEKVVMNKGFVSKREAKLKREEEEIEALEKELKGEGSSEEEENENGETENEGNQNSEQSTKPLTAEEETFKKRYGDLRRHMQEQKALWEKEKEKLSKAPQSLPATEEEVEQWIEDYPQVAAIVRSLAMKEAEKEASSKFEETKALAESLRIQKYELEQEKSETAIMKAHPDFKEIREDNAFHDWASKQPKVIQDALYENSDDAPSVISVLNLYKSETGEKPKPKKNKSSEADAASFIDGRSNTALNEDGSKSKWTESKVDKLSDIEYAKYADDIDAAVADGTFVYDISGSKKRA